MKIYTHTHIGKRKTQQDSFRLNVDSGIFVVCDGVGGSDHGAISSQLVSDYIYDNSKIVNNDQQLINTIIEANKALKQHLSQNGDGDGHTTLAIVKFWSEMNLTVFTVGDSRVYIFDTQNRETWHSKDHTMLQEIIDQGILAKDVEMKNHPLRHRLTHSIGSAKVIDQTQIAIVKKVLTEHERYIMICTDGVWELIENEVLLNELRMMDTSIFIKKLTELVNNYASDNATFIFIDLNEDV